MNSIKLFVFIAGGSHGNLYGVFEKMKLLGPKIC